LRDRVFTRRISTKKPAEAWVTGDPLYNIAETSPEEGFPILRAWAENLNTSFINKVHYELWSCFVVQMSEEEYETSVLQGDFPDNVMARIKRHRKTDPLVRV
jgi:hypothetical protein